SPRRGVRTTWPWPCARRRRCRRRAADHPPRPARTAGRRRTRSGAAPSCCLLRERAGSGRRALLADEERALDVIDLAAVLDEEAAGAGELVRLSGQHPHRQLLTGEVGARELVRVRGLGLVLVDGGGRGLVPPALQLLAGVVVRLAGVLARGVVICGHQRSVPGSRRKIRPGVLGANPRRGLLAVRIAAAPLSTLNAAALLQSGLRATTPRPQGTATRPRHGPRERTKQRPARYGRGLDFCTQATRLHASDQAPTERTTMRELELDGIHDDGEHVLLVDSDGERYTLRIDRALRAAVRSDRPALNMIQADDAAPLRPREIQAMLRSGRSAEDISEASEIPLEHVRRYEGPVLAEREWTAQRARVF